MSAPTSGLARVTIRAPRRRLDLALPHQVPLAEILPEVLRRAGEIRTGETTVDPDPARVPPSGGWVLRRGDGASLLGEVALAGQGVRDGDVLYLVPRNLTWPEPAYDDVVEEIATAARQHGRAWDESATRFGALGAAAVVLVAAVAALISGGLDATVAGLGAAVASVLFLGGGTLLSRAVGDGVTGAVAGGFALVYATVSGFILASGDGIHPDQVLVGASALLLASVIAGVAIGSGLRIFVAGMTTAVITIPGALLSHAVTGPQAASILVVGVVAGIGLVPLLAVRLGRLPLPVVSAVREVLARERRPDRPQVVAAVARADEILVGLLLGLATAGVGCVAVLATTTGLAGPLVGGLASAALILRARLFPTVAARVPLVSGGVLGLTVTAVMVLVTADSPARLAGVAIASMVVMMLIGAAATAHRRPADGSPYVGRLADIADVAIVIALVPVVCAVLDLYSWVRGLAG